MLKGDCSNMSIESNNQNKWDEIRQIHIQYTNFYRIFGSFILILLSILIGHIKFQPDTGYAVNIYTELISIGATVLIIDALNRQRDEWRQLQDTKNRLIMEAGSTSNETAKNGVHQLSKRGWLVGDNSLLCGKDLRGANLQGANFQIKELIEIVNGQGYVERIHTANLQGVQLMTANLSKANLCSVDLRGAYLVAADLEGASLWQANLSSADLYHADFQNAILCNASLQDARLMRANLKGADLRNTILVGSDLTEAKFDETTILPDTPIGGEINFWSSITDMKKYTDANHPEFWQSPLTSWFKSSKWV
jgi:uncharacterized protein YjbI with pentapeptide repeats